MGGGAELETVTIGKVRSKQWKMVGLGVLMTALSAYVGLVIAESTFHRFFGIAGLVMFGLATLVFVSGVMRRARGDVLVIGSDGFNYSGQAGFGFVAWSELEELWVVSVSGMTFVQGRVVSPDRLQRERGLLGRLQATMNRRSCDFWISDAALDRSAQEIYSLMDERCAPWHSGSA